MLTVTDLHVVYGVIQALKGITLSVEDGEIVALIGANGAGKSTLLRAVCGLIPVRRGDIRFGGASLESIPAHRRVAMGLAMVPEGRGIFPNLTTRENFLIGGYCRRKDRASIERHMNELLDLFPRLRERADKPGGTLSGGEQQMLAICRALLSRPRLLLLDEPSMGLAPYLIPRIFRMIREIRDKGTTVLLVEQNANAALRTADRAYVLETGQVVREGPARLLLGDDDVRAAYLG
ncbi:MAG: ABC transporter ATP-binding protein [Thermodesulfobacteriota bacterium]